MNRSADSPLRNVTLLIVDDTPENLGSVVDTLGERGFHVLIARDASEAIARARHCLPDLVLLDVDMGGITGFETCRRLKADARTRDIPVIFMTVADGAREMLEGFNAGGADYVTKPVRVDELTARMEVHLTMREMQKALVEQNRQLQQEVRARQQAEIELSRIRAELELRVAQRTSELALANDVLRAEIEVRQRAQAELKVSEARLRVNVEASPVPLCIGRLNAPYVLYANGPWRELFGIGEQQCEFDNHELYVDQADRQRVTEQVTRVGTIRDEEVELRRRDGSTFWATLTGRLATYRDEPAIYLGIRDITERKRIENVLVESREQLRQLSAHMEAIREEERKRIALEVHDELGQLLTALKMDVSLLKMRLSEAPELLKKVADMRELVERTIFVVRNVANHLRPAALNFGLLSALEWLSEDFTKRTGISCHLLAIGCEPVVSDTRATAVFRVVQESLTNVARHAGAKRVHVTVVSREEGLQIHVSDDGCGFDPAAAGKRDSYGLLGISERARLIGATLYIDSAPGCGTVISIDIPAKDGSGHD